MSWNPLSKTSPFYLFISFHILFFLSLSLSLPRWLWHCLVERVSCFVWHLAGNVVSPSLSLTQSVLLSIFFCLTRFQKALYLLSQGSTTLCINLFNYAFIYAAVALCKCTLWLNKLFRCLAVCSPHWVFASDIMQQQQQQQQETPCLWCVCARPIFALLNWWRGLGDCKNTVCYTNWYWVGKSNGFLSRCDRGQLVGKDISWSFWILPSHSVSAGFGPPCCASGIL